jgi:long-chain acyl-CoA synthetase
VRLAQRLRLARDKGLTAGVLLERLAGLRGDALLVEEDGDGGLRLTVGEAADRVARLAGGIGKQVGRGDRVVVAAPNGYGVFLLSLAVVRAGGVAVPVNEKMRAEEVDHVVSDSGARLVVRGLEDVAPAEPVPAAPAGPTDLAALFYTSGTTGKPKGAELSHRALVGSAPMCTLYPSGLRRDLAVSGMPVAHIAGFSMLVQFAALGIPVHLLRRFRPTDALDAIERQRATMFLGVPAMYRMMLEAGAESRSLRSVRVWISSADVMPTPLARRFQRLGAAVSVFGHPLGRATFVDGYGMVELGGGAAIKVSPGGIPLPLEGLVGIPLPGFHLRVVDDAGREVARGEVGELAVKGPGVMRGYHGAEADTAEAITPDGWLRTGDLARRRRFGLVEFAGRKKDVIKHGGYSVFAVEVETALEQHPAVAEAAVLGLPDERKGEVPVAAVRLAEGASLDGDELLSWAADRLADYKVPTDVRVLPELPRTGTDKVQKAALRDLF